MIRAAAAALALLGAQPVAACELALAFALDVSSSVDEAEYRLQLDGLGEALADPSVRAAILAQPGGVALAAYEWSGRYQQVIVAGWTKITDGSGIDAFAERLTAHPRGFDEFPTAIGYALGYGAVLLRDAPPCRRRVIDVSGDGVNNEGFPPEKAYAAFDFAGITVNGLAVAGSDPEVVPFYELRVARGPGSFVEVAADFGDYARAMKRKLLREVGGGQLAERAR